MTSSARNLAWNTSIVLLVVVLAAYFQTWVDLGAYLFSSGNHTTLLIAVILWMVWSKRRVLAGMPITPNAALVPAVLVLSAAWLLAERASSLSAYTLLWPVLAFMTLWAGTGWRVASALAFPLGALSFAMPLWEVYLEPPLQRLASVLVNILTNIVGIQAVIDNNRILLPEQTIVIALPCSGASFLIVALAMAAIAGELRGDRWPTRLLLMAIATVVALTFNAIRILLIAIGYGSPVLKPWLEKMGHGAFGWWVFTLALFVFYAILHFIPMRKRPPQSGERQKQNPEPSSPTWIRGVAAAAAAALLLPVSSGLASLAAHASEPHSSTLATPIALPGLSGPILPDLGWQPHAEGASWAHRAAYIRPDGRVVEIYRSQYDVQSTGKELISRNAPLFDGASFAIRDSRVVQVGRPNEPPLEATRSELVDGSGRKWLALHTYIIDNEIVASPLRARFLTALRALYGRPAAGVLAVMMQCGADCNAISADLDAATLVAHDAYQNARRGP